MSGKHLIASSRDNVVASYASCFPLQTLMCLVRFRCQGYTKVNPNNMAEWQNGYAADCKSVYLGSTPGSASISLLKHTGTRPAPGESRPNARVVKLVDTRDLKSLERKFVPVQVRPRAPFISLIVVTNKIQNKLTL